MLHFLKALFNISLLIAVLKRTPAKENVVLVHAIFRHGDYTIDPATIYPNDPYKNEEYYPFGIGKPTNRGKMREYLLGKFLRLRYNDFLGPYYTPEILDPRSTYFNRTKMSMQLVLAGLFPTVGVEVWNPELPWQPIPYNYWPGVDDTFLTASFACSNYDIYYNNEYLQSKEAALQRKRHHELFEYLTENSGWNVTDLQNLMLIYACLNAEHEWGFLLPEWSQNVFPEPLTKLAGLAFATYTSTPNLKKLYTGPFFQKIVQDTKKKINGTLIPQERKLFLYSGRDLNVAALLNTLGAFSPPHNPPFGSCVLFEVLEVQNKHIFRVYYKRNTYGDPVELMKIDGCEASCPLEQFEEIVEKYYLDEESDLRAKECSNF